MESAQARRLFDTNARTYDSVNQVVSLGLDRRWRAWAARQAVAEKGDRVLDLMTGTGELAIQAAKLGAQVTATDVSLGMMSVGRSRAAWLGLEVDFVEADVTVPASVPDGPYDAVTLSFGLRYLDDPVSVLREAAGRLTERGRLVVLEFCTPKNGERGSLPAFYYFRILPAIASRLGAGRELYDFLRDSTRSIGTAADIEALVAQAGYRVQTSHVMGFGLVAGMCASREPGDA